MEEERVIHIVKEEEVGEAIAEIALRKREKKEGKKEKEKGEKKERGKPRVGKKRWREEWEASEKEEKEEKGEKEEKDKKEEEEEDKKDKKEENETKEDGEKRMEEVVLSEGSEWQTWRVGAGYGRTCFWFGGEKMVFGREGPFGDPVSCPGKGVRQMDKFCVEATRKGFDVLLEEATQKRRRGEGVEVWTWNARGDHWEREGKVEKRSRESVVLDEKAASLLWEDVDRFCSDDAKEWYAKHGIPWKRGYLLHGPPGTGKTSTIAALATHLKRPIFKISLAAPGMCDSSLHLSMHRMHEAGVVALEDVDSLWGKHREKEDAFSVTFSGLLNALDGTGAGRGGCLFVLTSNHPSRLDPALTRAGRVDLKVEVGVVTPDQARRFFLRFYPGEAEEASKFAGNVRRCSFPLSPSRLQEHFVLHRLSPPSVASSLDPHVSMGEGEEGDAGEAARRAMYA